MYDQRCPNFGFRSDKFNLFDVTTVDDNHPIPMISLNKLLIFVQVVAAKERLDAKIEEKRLADLEAEIDAHNPSKKSTKLISSSSYAEKEGAKRQH